MIRFFLVCLALLWTLPAQAQMFCMCQVGSTATGFPNANSPIGTNLIEPSADGYTPENPFLNAFVLGGGWVTANSLGNTTDESILYGNCVDSNHFLNVSPASCTGSFGGTFTFLRTVIFPHQSAAYLYPSGAYIFEWDGPSDAAWTFNANDPVTSTACALTGHPNRTLLDATGPTGGGIEIHETGIGTGGHPTNIRLINATSVLAGDVASTCGAMGTRETAFNNGEILDPQFVSEINFYRLVRMMKWNETLHNNDVNWSDRSLTTWAFWNEGQEDGQHFTGIPYEVQIALCNKIHADCWFNEPTLATDSYITSLATLAHNTLNTSLHAVVEYGNEIFLPGNLDTAPTLSTLGNAAFPCGGNNAAEACPSGTGSVAGSVLTISTTNVNEWLAGKTVVSDGSGHTATIQTNGSGSGGLGSYNMSNSTLTGTSFTGVNPGNSGQNITNYGAFRAARSADLWAAVWTGADASRLYRWAGGDQGNTAYTQFVLNFQDTFYGGVACSGCSGNTWSGTVASRMNAGGTATYFPPIVWQVGCPRAWTADGDGGVNRCTTEYTTGGDLAARSPATTTTHTGPDKNNACSTALNVNAIHYSATVAGLTVTNGASAAITLDTPTIGPCDDISINGTVGLLQIDQNAFITAGSNISSTTFTVTSPATTSMTQCCNIQMYAGGTITGSGVSAGTFITAAPAGGTAGSYTVNNSQTVTCSPCYVSGPIDGNSSVANPCGGGHCSGGPYLMVFTNATSVGSMVASWRVECSGGGTSCFDQSGGWVGATLSTMTGDINVINGTYGLIYMPYEGWWQVQANNGDEDASLLFTMYRGTSIATISNVFLPGLRTAGLNNVYANFTALFTPNGAGLTEGTLENSREGTSPAWTAFKNFSASNPCWWSNCTIH